LGVAVPRIFTELDTSAQNPEHPMENHINLLQEERFFNNSFGLGDELAISTSMRPEKDNWPTISVKSAIIEVES
jgi:hypothetical protein